MALLGKNKEDEEQPEELEEGAEEGAEEEVVEEAPPEPELHPAIVAARDGARVCTLINNAIQSGAALLGGGSEEELQSLKDEAARCAARAHGTWQAIENGVLEVQAESAQKIGILADEDKLAELAAAVIIAARNELQDLLGRIDPEADQPAEEPDAKKP